MCGTYHPIAVDLLQWFGPEKGGVQRFSCLESSHHSSVIETGRTDLYGSYFRRKEWLKGERSLKTKWCQNRWTECNQECIINIVAEVLCVLSYGSIFLFSRSLKEYSVCFHGFAGRVVLQSYKHHIPNPVYTIIWWSVEMWLQAHIIRRNFSILQSTVFTWWVFFGVFLSIFASANSNSQIPTVQVPFTRRRKKMGLKCHHTSSERSGVWAQSEPCTHQPQPDKCKLFFLLLAYFTWEDEAYSPFRFNSPRSGRSAFSEGWYNTSVTLSLKNEL